VSKGHAPLPPLGKGGGIRSSRSASVERGRGVQRCVSASLLTLVRVTALARLAFRIWIWRQRNWRSPPCVSETSTTSLSQNSWRSQHSPRYYQKLRKGEFIDLLRVYKQTTRFRSLKHGSFSAHYFSIRRFFSFFFSARHFLSTCLPYHTNLPVLIVRLYWYYCMSVFCSIPRSSYGVTLHIITFQFFIYLIFYYVSF